MKSKVSVIVPVYNRKSVLTECVESILAQTYDCFEIILIDDGSVDGTVEICRRMASEDARIRLLERQHTGVSAARNVGIEAATGEYIFFVDSDDVIHPRLMENLVCSMINSGAALSGSNVVGIKEENWHKVREHLKQPLELGVMTHQTNEQAVNAMLTGRSPLGCIGGVMMHRDLIGQTRFRSDLFIGEDYYFIYENLIKGAEAEFLEQSWYYVRYHKDNSSWNYGYDGFYSRFLRRKLVWESEEAYGRTEYSNIQKREAVSIFFRCMEQTKADRDGRKKMRAVAREHRTVLLPALSRHGRILFRLCIYAPAVYSRLKQIKAFRKRR